MGDAGASAPTGCYKCGRPGHWSRDCPSTSFSASAATNPNPNLTFNINSPSSIPSKSSDYQARTFSAAKSLGKISGGTQKPKKLPKTRPKLIPELLLSNDGLGYILRYFPRNFKYRGRGHEVSDLRNLLSMYREWHAHLLPYYSFDQFVRKVEQVGSTKRVTSCLRELREKVANGGDPTKWDEPSVEEMPQVIEDFMVSEVLCQDKLPHKESNVDEMQEDILNEIYQQTLEGTLHGMHHDSTSRRDLRKDYAAESQVNRNPSTDNSIEVNDEQKAQMEAHRLKALERANAKARLLPAT